MPFKLIYVEYALIVAKLLSHAQREQVGNRAKTIEKVQSEVNEMLHSVNSTKNSWSRSMSC